MINDDMLKTARAALVNSYAPYSNFNVAAALLCGDGSIFSGCNIENAAFSPGNCAERTAFFKALSEGERDFKAILIIGGKNYTTAEICPPCGVCRQVMSEFCDKNFKIILYSDADGFKEFTLGELLPLQFRM